MPQIGKFRLVKMLQEDDYCRGFVGASQELICGNRKCSILSHGKSSAKWTRQDRTVFALLAIKAAKSATIFVIAGTWLSGDNLPDDVFRTASEDSKTPKQWVEYFFPYALARAAEHNRLDKEEGDEEDSDTGKYFVGMDLDASDMPRVVEFNPLPTVVYPRFMAEEEVRDLEDDGPYATKMREAISGVRNRLSDVQLVARKDAERVMGYVENSNHWLMEHISILH